MKPKWPTWNPSKKELEIGDAIRNVIGKRILITARTYGITSMDELKATMYAASVIGDLRSSGFEIVCKEEQAVAGENG